MVVYKFFAMGEYEKKEKWINNMCSKGYALKSCNMCKFYFEPCTPDEYYYSLELLENLPKSPYSEDFINYLQDEWCVEYVCQYRNWAFFRREKSQGKFSLFPGVSEKVFYFKRILISRLIMILLLLGIGSLSMLYSTHGSTDETFACLLFLIDIIVFIFNIPNYNKYVQLKKSDES